MNDLVLIFYMFISLVGYCQPYTLIPDPNFEDALAIYDDIPNDGQVPTNNINIVTQLQIQNQNIHDMTGVQDFIALKHLNCSYNAFTTIDISNNLALELFSCNSGSDKIQSLDVSQNLALKHLYITDQLISSIDLTNNVNLETLEVDFNELTSLDLSANVLLWHLICSQNSLTTLDLSHNPDITWLECGGNQLANINLSGISFMQTLDLNNNSLTEFPAHLETIYFATNPGFAHNNIGGCWPTRLSGLCYRNFNCDGNIYDGVNNFISYQGWMDFCNNQTGECPPCPHPDYPALEEFYTSTNGNTWLNKTGWRQDCDPCGIISGTPWFGITCEQDQVTKIELPNNNLTGSFPTEIGDFSNLEWIDLAGNDMGNNIPTNLCNLATLRHLNLFSNNFTGPLPPCLADYEELELVNVADNTTLDGMLPEFNSDNISLNTLSFSNNQFTGPFPETYGDIPILTILEMNDNDLTGPYHPNLGGLCGNYLNAMISDGNNFNIPWETWCSIPCAYVPDDQFETRLIELGYDVLPLDNCVPIPNIENVLSLDISNEGIEDLTGIEFFTSLEIFNCSHNDIVDMDLSANTALTNLDASYNMISCFNLGFENLTNLSDLDFSHNNIAGCWPDEMSTLCGINNYNFDFNYDDGVDNFISNDGWDDFCNLGDGACIGSFDGWAALHGGLDDNCFGLDIDLDGNIIACGKFTDADGITAYRVAKWDVSANNWSHLNNGITNNSANAVKCMPNGNIFLGGSFNSIDGVSIKKIAMWDASNSTWNALGSGLQNGNCKAIVADNNEDIYVGGSFAKANNSTANGIAKWSATSSTWSFLDDGIGPVGIDGIVYALAIDNSNQIYVGGIFNNAGGTPANNIAKWNPANNTWTALGDGFNGVCRALVIDGNGELFAGGSFDASGSAPILNIAKWDAANSTWMAMDGGLSNHVKSLTVDNANNVYAGGAFVQSGGIKRIAMWDASNSVWTSVGSGLKGGQCLALTNTNTHLYAGGSFTQVVGGEDVSKIAQFEICKENIITTCVLADGCYAAADLIQSTSAVNNGGTVTFNAPSILLNPGFSVNIGSTFTTQTEGCD